MLTVTEGAAAHLADVLVEAEAEEGAVVRFLFRDGGLALVLDVERPGDATVAHEGKTVLVFDQEASDALDERTLDIESTEDGPKLALH